MSVINDVLKDLHKRRNQKGCNDHISFVYENDTPLFQAQRIYVLVLLLAFVVILAIFYYGNTMNSNDKVIDIYSVGKDQSSFNIKSNEVLNEEIILDPIDVASIPFLKDKNKNLDNEVEDIVGFKEVVKDTSIETSNLIEPNSYPKHVVSESKSDLFLEEKDNKLINLSNTRIINKKKDEVIIRKLMNDEPEKVWPYIKKIMPSSKDKVGLLALAAQGEQRSNNHNVALSLYKTLSEIEPHESKWKAGLAISYDALGENQKALISYKSALQFNSLPPALYSFVSYRISLLSGNRYE